LAKDLMQRYRLVAMRAVDR